MFCSDLWNKQERAKMRVAAIVKPFNQCNAAVYVESC